MSDQSPATLLDSLGGGLVSMATADVGRSREKARTRRWVKLTFAVWAVVTVLLARAATMSPSSSLLPVPHLDPAYVMIGLFFGVMILVVVLQFVMTGKSPHVIYRPDQLSTRLDDVVGIDGVKDEAIKTLNLFLAHRTFADAMGGKPRRGVLFEGPPGTGKTHLARAMAREAGVPFLFASGTQFVSSFQGASSRKVRSFFKALSKVALKEGGAIAFIEEIDVIAAARSGVSTAMTPMTPMSSTVAASCSGTLSLPAAYGQAAPGLVTNGFTGGSDTSSIVNELLVQMQSFDRLTGGQKLLGKLIDKINLMLPLGRQLRSPQAVVPNILIIAATNRASSLDPALLRPGRFDRKIGFELPAKSARRELLDYFLSTKAHKEELDDERRDALAATTIGYSPAMLENLLDEALVFAVRRGDKAMTWADVEHARMTIEVGVGQPVEYTDHERRLIATHEAGHATMAYLTAPDRRLEILTIIKRKGSLGLLAHGDKHDVYTRSRSEMEALIQIAMGGQCAEEIFFGDVSTGPGGDLLYATNCAAEMVGAHGMEKSLVSYLAVQNSAFSDTNIVGRVLADAEGRQAVEEVLQKHKQRARELLTENRHLVEALRDALLARHELLGREITEVLETARATPRTIDLRAQDQISS
ncbi:MAG: ATPase central domain protein [Frankiales bacterium]|nr:ATPase central domain protein [Frankiales bacterium]